MHPTVPAVHGCTDVIWCRLGSWQKNKVMLCMQEVRGERTCPGGSWLYASTEPSVPGYSTCVTSTCVSLSVQVIQLVWATGGD